MEDQTEDVSRPKAKPIKKKPSKSKLSKAKTISGKIEAKKTPALKNNKITVPKPNGPKANEQTSNDKASNNQKTNSQTTPAAKDPDYETVVKIVRRRRVKGIGFKEIKKRTKIKDTKIRNILYKAKQNNEIENISRGLYIKPA
jgi:hypothetical protein